MKIKKATYFSFLFLLCFLASFSVSVVKKLNTSISSSKKTNYSSIAFNKHNDESTDDSEILFEENENEPEPDFVLQYIEFKNLFNSLLFYNKQIKNSELISRVSVAKVKPIYLSVCNFRI